MSDQTNPRQLVVFTLFGEQSAVASGQVIEIISYKQPRSAASSDSSIRGVLNLCGQLVRVYGLTARRGVSCEPRAGRRDREARRPAGGAPGREHDLLRSAETFV
ncbi:MAG: chemotaxis protein CheW [Solirubrobacteraceae bacterium]|jgi:chemotaxis signal transduction protein